MIETRTKTWISFLLFLAASFALLIPSFPASGQITSTRVYTSRRKRDSADKKDADKKDADKKDADKKDADKKDADKKDEHTKAVSKEEGEQPAEGSDTKLEEGEPGEEEGEKSAMPWKDDSAEKYGTHLPWGEGVEKSEDPEMKTPGEEDPEATSEKADEAEKELLVYSVKAFGTTKTTPETLLAIAAVKKGDLITPEYIEEVRKRVINSQLFREVKVFFEELPHKEGWAYLFIEARDRHSWFIAPMFQWQDGRWGGAFAYGESNLFGWGKRLGVAGRYLNDSQGLGIVYDDPKAFGTPLTYRVGLGFQRNELKEYPRIMGPVMKRSRPARRVWIQQLFGSFEFGYRFFKQLSVKAGYEFGMVAFGKPECPHEDPETGRSNVCGPPEDEFSGAYPGPIAFKNNDETWNSHTYRGGKFWNWKREARFGIDLDYDRIIDIYGVQQGHRLRFELDVSHPYLGSEFKFAKWMIYGKKIFPIFKTHYIDITFKHEQTYNAPFHRELFMGGRLLPGYVHRLALGDTNTAFMLTYNLPLFKVWWFHFRQVFYYRNAWIFFRKGGGEEPYFTESAGVRRYHLAHTPGPRDRASFLQSIGTGLRLYVKALAIPLLGADIGYGFESNDVRFYFYLGRSY